MALAIDEMVKGERHNQYLFMGLATRKGEGVDCYHLLSQVLEISVSVRSVQVFLVVAKRCGKWFWSSSKCSDAFDRCCIERV